MATQPVDGGANGRVADSDLLAPQHHEAPDVILVVGVRAAVGVPVAVLGSPSPNDRASFVGVLLTTPPLSK